MKMTEEKKKSKWWVGALVGAGLLISGFFLGQVVDFKGKPQVNVETRWPPLDKDSLRTLVNGKEVDWQQQVVIRTETIPSYTYRIDTLWGRQLWGIGMVILQPSQATVFWRGPGTPDSSITASTFSMPNDFEWGVVVDTEGDSVSLFIQDLISITRTRRTIILVDAGISYDWHEDSTWVGRPAISLGVSWHPWKWLKVGPRIGFQQGFYAGFGVETEIPIVRR
jgi:hypothetical protein